MASSKCVSKGGGSGCPLRRGRKAAGPNISRIPDIVCPERVTLRHGLHRATRRANLIVLFQRLQPPPAMIRVLVVDDDESARLFLGSILEAAGHFVFYARTGEEAIRAFLRKGAHVVVTDLEMPRGDGFELIDAIVGINPDVPVIAVSGMDTGRLERARELGARITIAKPVEPATLVSSVEAVTRSVA